MRERSSFLALDPGLDEVAYAVFGLENIGGRILALPQAPAAFRTAGTWYTEPKHSFEARLLELAGHVAELAKEHNVVSAAIERQRIGGTYRQLREKGVTERLQASSLQAQQTASGVLFATLAAVGVEKVYFVPPALNVSRTPEAIARVLPNIGRTNEHVRAALAIAFNELTDLRRRWAA